MEPKIIYKADSGPIFTKAIFYEISDKPEWAQLTLKEKDHVVADTNPVIPGKKLPSAPRLFIEHTLYDPTEVTFADEVFGSWEAWEKMTNSPILLPYIEKWRREADIRRKALAFRQIVEEAASGGKSAMSAARFLIEEPWKAKGDRTADGRATRKNVRETAEEAFKRSAIEDDLKRLKDEGIIQ